MSSTPHTDEPTGRVFRWLRLVKLLLAILASALTVLRLVGAL